MGWLRVRVRVWVYGRVAFRLLLRRREDWRALLCDVEGKRGDLGEIRWTDHG